MAFKMKKEKTPKKVGKRLKKKVAGVVTHGTEIIHGEEHTVTRDAKGNLISKSIL